MNKLFMKLTAAAATSITLAGCQVETVNQPAAAPGPVAEAVPAAPSASAGQVSQVTAFGPRVEATGGTMRNRARTETRMGFFAEAREVGGELAICGVQLATGLGTQRFVPQLASQIGFFVDGQLVLRGVGYFTRTRSIDTVEDTAPTCKSTGRPWEKRFATAPWLLDNTGGSTFHG